MKIIIHPRRRTARMTAALTGAVTAPAAGVIFTVKSRFRVICRSALAVASAVVLTASGGFPAQAASASSHVFPTMNDGGGIYWRSGTDWNTAIRQAGQGVYPGTDISVSCYQLGTANVPGSTNAMWVRASWASGPGTGSGWINEHFVNDGAPLNQAAAGIPPCSSGPGCNGNSCTGLNPTVENCNHVKTIASVSDGDLTAALRYSSDCNAVWVKIFGPTDYQWGGAVAGYTSTSNANASVEYIATPPTSSGSYSDMVSFHYWTKACIAFNSSGWETLQCTRFH
jgi:hypothetical protein